MVQKIPPPPPIANQDPTFNRWLLELTAILNAGGGIDANSVNGLPEVIAQSAANAVAIAALQTVTGGQTASIAALNVQVTSINGQIVTINGQITALGARAQPLNGIGVPAAGLGNVGDWYANIGGAVGARIYVKTAPAVWTPFPF
jgi:hypothetical protein